MATTDVFIGIGVIIGAAIAAGFIVFRVAREYLPVGKNMNDSMVQDIITEIRHSDERRDQQHIEIVSHYTTILDQLQKSNTTLVSILELEHSESARQLQIFERLSTIMERLAVILDRKP